MIGFQNKNKGIQTCKPINVNFGLTNDEGEEVCMFTLSGSSLAKFEKEKSKF
jgi:hypothetical protein